MTRRVSFTPFVRAGLFVAGLLAAGGPARAADVPFAPQSIVTTTALHARSAAVADVDGDGDNDLVSPADPFVVWHENLGGNGATWAVHTVASLMYSTELVADMDGDGDGDVVAASFNSGFGSCTWFENTAGNGTAWTTHGVLAGAGVDGCGPVDMDGDSDLDLLIEVSGATQWHENLTGSGTSWTAHTVAGVPPQTAATGAADIDGDGDADLLLLGAPGIGWHENVAGNGTVWVSHTIPFPSTASVALFSVADLDGDGDLDSISAESSNYDSRIYWQENVAGNGTVWTARTIVTLTDYLRNMTSADVDRDGDVDVVFAHDQPLSGAIKWAENTSGNGTAWTLRTMAASLGPGLIPDAVAAADIDGDGDPDGVTVSGYAHWIVWHRNESIHESACFATRTPVATGLGTASQVAAADVDGDGDSDGLVAVTNFAGPPNPKLLWTENAAGNGSSWASHAIATGNDQTSVVVAADVDGDGDADALTIGYYSGLGWWRNNGNGTAWTGLPIGGTGLATAAADIDGDGDLDALTTTNFFNPFVHWWENVAGNGTSWTSHTIATLSTAPWGPSYSVAAADIDGDGDMDVLSHNGYFVTTAFWFENVAGNGTTWAAHTLPMTTLGALVPADVDGDGDQDVLTNTSPVAWLENTLGNGTAWAVHTIGAGAGSGAFVTDLDRDGDLDAVLGLSWAENAAGNGSSWFPRSLPAGDAVSGVSAADFDGDGDPDILATSPSTGHVDWFENRSGQVSMTGTDVSPGGAANGDLVPLLRIEVRHLGRSGDGDLELASLGLLFEEAAGDPLTSAEANALIANLHVYRDANGNGSFDPGTDTLVTTVATLALTGGVQTVAFTGGDPNLQVTLASPRTYFVVAELDGSASGQTPNEFQVTHLATGPSASSAEDRTYDIPQRTACPANVTAAVGPITPVELLDFRIE